MEIENQVHDLKLPFEAVRSGPEEIMSSALPFFSLNHTVDGHVPIRPILPRLNYVGDKQQ